MSHHLSRRQLLRRGASAVSIGIAASATLLSPVRAIAGSWPAPLIEQTDPTKGLDELTNGRNAQPHADFIIDTPDEAENGSQVQISLRCPLPKVDTVALILTKNPYPIAAVYHPVSGWTGLVTTRVKLAASGRVTAIARAGNTVWRADKDIKVVAGGCA